MGRDSFYKNVKSRVILSGRESFSYFVFLIPLFDHMSLPHHTHTHAHTHFTNKSEYHVHTLSDELLVLT